jgi:hypothetical protein
MRPRAGARVALVTLLLLAAALLGSASTRQRAWLDRTRPVAERIELLLPQMSLEEKIAQLNRPNAVTNATLTSGVGLLMHTTFLGANVTDTVRRRNALQRQFLETGVGKRLGIPASWRSFIHHGACAFGVTFPENAGQGSTWNVELVWQIAAANAAAARAIGLDMEWYVMNLWAVSGAVSATAKSCLRACLLSRATLTRAGSLERAMMAVRGILTDVRSWAGSSLRAAGRRFLRGAGPHGRTGRGNDARLERRAAGAGRLRPVGQGRRVLEALLRVRRGSGRAQRRAGADHGAHAA